MGLSWRGFATLTAILGALVGAGGAAAMDLEVGRSTVTEIGAVRVIVTTGDGASSNGGGVLERCLDRRLTEH
jgi:hypothetical protein